MDCLLRLPMFVDLTFEEVNFVWTQIAQGFKKGNFINKYVMMNREISLIDSNIHIKVEGEVQMQQFNDSLKLELVGTLREKLKNDTIDISLDLMAGEVSDKMMIYTQSDKYDLLSLIKAKCIISHALKSIIHTLATELLCNSS